MIFFIKNLGLLICCIYYYTKLLHLTTPKYFLLRCSIFSVTLSYISIFSELHYPYYTIPLLILSTLLFLSCNIKITLTISITATTIAFVLSTITLFASSIITATFFANFYDNKHNTMIQILSCLFQLLLMLLPFRIKRWKKGMPFLYKEVYAFSGMLISLFALLIFILVRYMKINDLKLFLLLALIMICIITLIIYHYWQNNITKTYRDRLKEREIAELNQSVASLSEKITELESDVIRLDKIVHKDNSVIPEYAFIVREHLTNHGIKEQDYTIQDKQLLERLDKLTAERKNILHQQEVHCNTLPATNVFAIDTLLKFKQRAAMAEHIDLQATISCDVPFFVEEVVNVEDLHTLLTYLLDNATIATKDNKGRHIMLCMSSIDDVYTISVFDSGIPFTTEVIANWGLKQTTTHKDGHGIGMMEIYEKLKKYKASFIINEVVSGNQLYTKKLTIAFDNKNQYILQTNRPTEEIEVLSQRADLKIMKE